MADADPTDADGSGRQGSPYEIPPDSAVLAEVPPGSRTAGVWSLASLVLWLIAAYALRDIAYLVIMLSGDSGYGATWAMLLPALIPLVVAIVLGFVCYQRGRRESKDLASTVVPGMRVWLFLLGLYLVAQGVPLFVQQLAVTAERGGLNSGHDDLPGLVADFAWAFLTSAFGLALLVRPGWFVALYRGQVTKPGDAEA